jgi:hypothetical protein
MDPMSVDVSFSCVKHPMTMGEHICGECGHQFCPECVVFPFGTSRPPMCIACALERGGVRRQSVGRPKLTRRSIKERLAAQRELADHASASRSDRSDAPVVGGEEFLRDDVDPDRLPGAWRQQY